MKQKTNSASSFLQKLIDEEKRQDKEDVFIMRGLLILGLVFLVVLTLFWNWLES